MALTKQAKILDSRQINRVKEHLKSTRHPDRNLLMFLLSVKAGLRAKEIASLSWKMVTTPDGDIADQLHLINQASKGKQGGRSIPLNPELKQALVVYHLHNDRPTTGQVFLSERGETMSAKVVTHWFARLYKHLHLEGCSSHSGRRTFITNAARKISSCGGSLREIQLLAGHSSISVTERYIQYDSQAAKKVVDLI